MRMSGRVRNRMLRGVNSMAGREVHFAIDCPLPVDVVFES